MEKVRFLTEADLKFFTAKFKKKILFRTQLHNVNHMNMCFSNSSGILLFNSRILLLFFFLTLLQKKIFSIKKHQLVAKRKMEEFDMFVKKVLLREK